MSLVDSSKALQPCDGVIQKSMSQGSKSMSCAGDRGAVPPPRQDGGPPRHAAPRTRPLSSSVLLSSLELSDTKVYEPEIRALLGTASHFSEALATGIGGGDGAGRVFALGGRGASRSLSLSLFRSLSLARSLFLYPLSSGWAQKP